MTRTFTIPLGIWLWLVTAALAICTAAQLAAADPATTTAWELWPYRVNVLTAVEPGEPKLAEFEQVFAPFLKAHAAAVVGGMWQLEVSPALPELRHRILAEIGSLSEEDVPATSKRADKVMLVGVRSVEGGFQVRAREFDVVTGLWNSTFTIDVPQAALLRHEALRAVLSAFAPLARIEKTENDVVTLRLRASALLRRDQKTPLVVAGTVFRPVLVTTDSKGNVTPGKVEPIEWTYLTATEVESPLAKCRLQTGLSGTVVPDYHPLRQRWALAVTPSSESTRLRLVSADAEKTPLEGCDVLAEEASSAEGKSPRLETLGHSDRSGAVVVPPGPQTVRTLVIRHGDEVLARLPMVPGLTEEVTLPLALDSKRLELETALRQLADDLVDLAARREVLSARIRAAEQAKRSDDAGKLREQLRGTAGADALLARLDKLDQSVQSASAETKRQLHPKLAELRKAIEPLKAAGK